MKHLKVNLKKSYKNYIELWKKVDEKTKSNVINNTYDQLRRYFRYKGSSRAEKSYEDQMYKEFGKYIEPNLWLDNGRLTRASVKNCIKNQILSKAGSNLNYVPRGLTASAFFYNPFIKLSVDKKLKDKGIPVTEEFDYTYEKFKESYDKFTSLKFQKAIDHFYSELEKKIGKNDLKLEDEWNDFVYSDYLKKEISSKIKFNEDLQLDTLLKVIESQDLNQYREMIYLPKTIQEIEKKMYSREQFMNDEKAIKDGDDAIRLLYVPPFALAVSILALLLNTITVISMGLEYTNKLSSSKILIIKVFILITIILLPFIMGYNGFDNELINNISNGEIETYFNFLNWIGFYENINSAIH